MSLKRIDITLADGSTRTVTPNLTDRIAFEVHLRANRHLGGIGENAIRFQAFIAWSAFRRECASDMTWDEFLEGGALDVAPHDDEPADSDSEVVEDLGEGIPAGPLMS